ncbi:Rieske 2Fe-2S domain-containing protein [Kiloniella sp. b19]|uniref:Rieske 2Fe-2S domain-containing protein n=1 Tax=Kiloniella sp. GXU_MW_B19 TaxID=3141326 RepID=UPI0031DFA2EA
MSVKFEPVIWNRSKLGYDLVLLVMTGLYIYSYLDIAPAFQDVSKPLDGAIIRMQAFGTCAFLMLSMILCIGPLARLDTRFLPLLYNRRHFGVITCAIALVHAEYVLGWYFAFSPTDRFVALLGSNTNFDQFHGFPFEVFGIFALFVMLVMALTSHDFWLTFLGPPLWKKIHMGIYFAYAALVFHIGLGYLQTAKNPVFALVAGLCVTAVSLLHWVAARREHAIDEDIAQADQQDDRWLFAGTLDETVENKAIIVTPPEGDKIAIFRYGKGKLSALSNVCAHQNGPLGEGQIKFGCVTCPWHGFQYDPATGRAPAPFTEKLPTYNLKLDGHRILVDKNPNEPGTAVDPVIIPADFLAGEEAATA